MSLKSVKEKFLFPFLFIAGVFLFSINNAFVSWFVYVPLYVLADKVSFKKCFLIGGLFLGFSYVFFLSWLINYSFIGSLAAFLLHFLYGCFLFFELKLCGIVCNKNKVLSKLEVKWFLYAVSITLFEYVKTKGFFGLSYGINGYTQYKNICFIQLADRFGVFGVSFVLNISSAVISCYLDRTLLKKTQDEKKLRPSGIDLFYFAVLMFIILISNLYGFIRIRNERKTEKKVMKVVAVQHNTDPWLGGISEYENDVRVLKMLTDEAIEQNPDIEIVVWPETAVIPDIRKNYLKPVDERRNKLVLDLLEYMNSKKCAFVIGNYESCGEDDYNSVYLFKPNENILPPNPDVYRKIHLVPCSEYFPYEKQFPKIYEYLLHGDTHLWSPGAERKVFSYKDINFSTPVCFEDFFGSETNDFKRKGAAAFFSLSNDAWSKSKKCQIQHLQAAVFRSVENHVPTVRSTTSGETCIIDSIGKIKSRCKAFEPGFVVGEIEY